MKTYINKLKRLLVREILGHLPVFALNAAKTAAADRCFRPGRRSVAWLADRRRFSGTPSTDLSANVNSRLIRSGPTRGARRTRRESLGESRRY